ncbi:TniQ protein [Modicisalibacter muralis]|uniref:TniQ protein n=1 Tax=Modicisalibacter muralis TaxID=119000 RepID=A0A1G9LI19_9GAMM|nr:TniQ family protein [Halomonas muralis]SDL61508.1 TniQ protein [Halomonas muralis]
MQLLVRPKPFFDESLESYLLRLAEANFIESYRLLSGAVKDWLLEQDHEASGAFPLELDTVNIWHARQNSSLRVRAFSLLEKLTDNEDLPLLALSLSHSGADFCGGYRALARGSTHIPRCFIRKSVIPVCPLCLAENPYIPQAWHYLTYSGCIKHGVYLIYECPSCGGSLSYIENEMIRNCRCGYDLSMADTTQADQKTLLLSQLASCEEVESPNSLGGISSISIRNAALLYFCITNSVDLNSEAEVEESLRLAIEFYESWPSLYVENFWEKFNKANRKLIKTYNKTPVAFAAGPYISAASLIKGMRIKENFILIELQDLLRDLVAKNPKSRIPNPGDMLLTIIEAAVLLQTTHEQIYLLHEKGYLKSAYRIQMRQKVSPYESIFYLRQVIELAKTRMPPDFGAVITYLPHW